MATKAEALPSEPTSFASDLAGIPSFLIDPESAARRVRSKWFWVGPIVLSAIITLPSPNTSFPMRYMRPRYHHFPKAWPRPNNTVNGWASA